MKRIIYELFDLIMTAILSGISIVFFAIFDFFGKIKIMLLMEVFLVYVIIAPIVWFLEMCDFLKKFILSFRSNSVNIFLLT
jgi:hypothetical protein